MRPKDYLEAGHVAPLRQAIANREFSISDLVAACVERIDALDPHINAVIAVNPRAMARAAALDDAMPGPESPPLYGIPVLVKDNIETSEQPTTAGSLALSNNRTGRDAPIIARLREAGAIILGKTNLSEWANFRSTRSSSGWSGVGGQTRNPHDLARSPCGSSSGSAAAVAARLAPLAIGTETNGSVVCPAGVNGVVGIKPTVGLLPSQCIVPISHSQDTAGPMALDVAGAAMLLAAMQGKPAVAPKPADLAGKRIGVVRSAMGYHEGVDACFGTAIDQLRAAGAEIIEGLELKPYKGFRGDTLNIMLYEFKHGLNAYLAGLPNDLSGLDLAQLVEYNRAHSKAEMQWFQQELFDASLEKGGLNSNEYTEALARAARATREDGIDKLLDGQKLDVLVAPTGGPAWCIDLVNGDHGLGGFSTYPAVSGYPHVTVPMGDVHGLPVGLSFAAGAGDDETLIGLAAAFESVRGPLAGLPAGIEKIET